MHPESQPLKLRARTRSSWPTPQGAVDFSVAGSDSLTSLDVPVLTEVTRTGFQKPCRRVCLRAFAPTYPAADLCNRMQRDAMNNRVSFKCKCRYCKAILSSGNNYTRHLRKVHGEIVSRKGQRLCTICYAVLPVQDFDQHRREKHNIEPLQERSWLPSSTEESVERSKGISRPRFVQVGLGTSN